MRDVPVEVLQRWREADAREAEALGHVGEAVDLLAHDVPIDLALRTLLDYLQAWERDLRPPRRSRARKAVISPELRWEVFKRDDFRCVDCGTRDDLTCDHVEPEVRGGPTTLENLRTRCVPCNSRKGTR